MFFSGQMCPSSVFSYEKTFVLKISTHNERLIGKIKLLLFVDRKQNIEFGHGFSPIFP